MDSFSKTEIHFIICLLTTCTFFLIIITSCAWPSFILALPSIYWLLIDSSLDSPDSKILLVIWAKISFSDEWNYCPIQPKYFTCTYGIQLMLPLFCFIGLVWFGIAWFDQDGVFLSCSVPKSHNSYLHPPSTEITSMYHHTQPGCFNSALQLLLLF